MKTSFKPSHLLVGIFFVQCLFVLPSAAQPLPDGWWEKDSPEAVLAKSKIITSNLLYLKTSKAKILGDPANGFELLARRRADGKIETKLIHYHLGQLRSVTYNVREGSFFLTEDSNVPIKEEFESETAIEARTASLISRPYEYVMLKPDQAGTNKCQVVRSQMTSQMIESLGKEFHRAFPKFGLENMRTAKDYYIRESDGILLGYLGRAGVSPNRIMDDRLADTASTSPIPPEEFIVPKALRPIATKSLDDAVDISTANMIKAELQKERKQKMVRLGFAALVIAIPIALLIFYFQRNSSPKD